MAGDLEDALAQVLEFCGPVMQKRIMRKIAGYMAKVNRKRMKANIQPDGSAMPKRKGISSSMTFKEYMSAVWKRPAKKIEKSSAGATPYVIYQSKIKKAKRKMFSPHQKDNGKKSKGMGSVLKLTYDSDFAQIAFTGAMGKTATQHHYGLKASSGKSSFKLDVRELLGLPDDDQQAIADIILTNIDSVLKTGKTLSIRGN